jgi:hypothetical protein
MDLAGLLMSEIPVIELSVLDTAGLDARARNLRVRLRQLQLEAELALLRARPRGDPAEEPIYAEKELRLVNALREGARRLEEITRTPPATTDMRRRQGRAAAADVRSSADVAWQTEAKQKIEAMLISLDFSATPASSIVEFLHEITGLNLVLRGSIGTTPVTLKLKDVPVEGVLNHLAEALAARWEVDRFGVIVIQR